MGYKVGLAGEAQYQPAIGRCKEGQKVEVLHEVGNPHDPRALVVKTTSGAKLGYIPRSSWLQEAIHDEDLGCSARIAHLNRERGQIGVVIEVAIDRMGYIEQCDYRC